MRIYLNDDVLDRLDCAKLIVGKDIVVEVAGLEAFEGHRLVAVIFEANLVEVPLPTADREMLAPIVGNALVSDAAAGTDLLDAIGT